MNVGHVELGRKKCIDNASVTVIVGVGIRVMLAGGGGGKGHKFMCFTESDLLDAGNELLRNVSAGGLILKFKFSVFLCW